uniref:MBD domain-containing protein n=1 Tax=Oryza meridionalis TaxID=40149 RepID=A0A0E0DB51_9ORYZ
MDPQPNGLVVGPSWRSFNGVVGPSIHMSTICRSLIDLKYYICPLSGTTFTTKSEVLDYLFSEMDQCFLESKNHAVGSNLTRTHEWLPKGWLVEIRAGGDNMDKMYKFYVYPPNRVRLFSKDDILAILEFNPEGVPQGWVKEVHYTDPIKIMYSVPRAALYVETGKVTIRAFVQKTSVHEVYSFEKFTHLHESLWKRLELGGTNQLRTRSSKLRKLSLKEEILSDEQGSTSSKLVPEEQKFMRFLVLNQFLGIFSSHNAFFRLCYPVQFYHNNMLQTLCYKIR